MDPSPVPITPPIQQQQQQDDYDEWDTDGFVIPSLVIEEQDKTNDVAPIVEDSKPPSPKEKKEENMYLGPHRAPPSQSKQQEEKKEENIYLGPHRAPPSQSKQQEVNPSSRKQKFKQKLKEADRKSSASGRENKLDNLRELVGGGKGSSNMAKGPSRDWLDPHCHESQFERWHPE